MPDESSNATDEPVVRSNGWFLIRNTEDHTQWLATDSPVEVRR
ncbi:hypothetical protein [Natronorarus salvus]|jgi:hypothetical protein